MTESKINAIGYEGDTIEQFLARLLQNEIELVIDVRANPSSMKSGFSKSDLPKHLSEVGIKYVHFSALGIPSHIRKEITGITELLDYYDNHILTVASVQKAAKQVSELCRQFNSTIMCFEANPLQCHRSRLAKYICKNYGLQINYIPSSVESDSEEQGTFFDLLDFV